MQQRFSLLLTVSFVGLLIISSNQATAQPTVSGYVQAEWLHFDQSSNPDKRAFYWDAEKNFFQIRRGRAKFTHHDGAFKGVLQADFTERGVDVKDAYLQVNLVKENLLNVTVGLFNRPNYEVELSSSKRESPERSQVIRAFYPGERDLGFKFESSPKLSEDFIPTIQLALFNGNPNESDALKDIATRLILPLPLGKESKVSATVGGSFYYGGIPQPEDSVISFENGMPVITFGNGTGASQGWGNRTNVGIEAQVHAKLFSFGSTHLTGEFLSGMRPTTTTREITREVQDGDTTIIVTTAQPTLAIRNQSGFYVQLAQDLSKKYTVAAKYDVFDRNTDLSGNQVSSSSDRQATVIGFGAIGTFGPVRITAWYEMPTFAADEATFVDGSGATKSDDLKDNKTTVRFQYKF
ncbi:MAG: hypothetical protein KDD67_03070 [Ignavibacteriae bacterium]|nr:hypothetical protein [Ignavibacteriota bacterium]MCB9217021.1 hypothetical protein [Ignavibacteria bacterium]